MHNLKHFESLYQCKIESTGNFVSKPSQESSVHTPISFLEKILLDKEREIAIKMPESEFNKFVANWNQYMDILLTSNSNPQVREQFQQLMLLVHMLK